MEKDNSGLEVVLGVDFGMPIVPEVEAILSNHKLFIIGVSYIIFLKVYI